MTSSRNRRRSSTRRPGPLAPVLRRALVFGGALAAFAVALYAFFVLSPARLDPVAARDAAARSIALLDSDNPTAARDKAIEAVRSDPNSAEAHLALARAQLQLEDGIGAEAELRRAIDGGLDAKAAQHLLAEAQLLQNQPQRAIELAEKTDPRFRPYGLRIRARALTALGNYAAANAALAEAMRIAPRDGNVWTDVGRFRFIAGDMLGAIEASERAVELDPGGIDALVLRGELVRAQYGLIAALPWFERALGRDPAYHDALIEYAATLGDAGRTRAMLAVTRRALAARPSSAEAFYLQGVLAARAGDFDLARAMLGRAGSLSVPGALLLGGTLDLQSGDYGQAADKLRQLVGAQPMNITARKLLAAALLRSDAARNAIDLLRPVTARGDADSYALTLMARGFERIGERGEAARFLDRAAYPAREDSAAFSSDDSASQLAAGAQLRPGDPTAVVPMIRAQIDNGDAPSALARAQQIARTNPGAPGAHIVVGDVLMLLDRHGEAAAAYQRAADLRFDEPVMLRLVEALDRAGRRAEATNALALFLSQNPVNVAALRLTAHWQLAGREYDGAIDTLELLRLRLGNRDAGLETDLSAAYAGAGEYEEAQRHGQTAYLLQPANPAAADAFGWAMFRNGDTAGALELLQKAVILAPRHSGLRWHLAQAYAEANRRPEARLHAQAALADPAFPERAAASALVARFS